MAVQNLRFLLLQISHQNPNHKLLGRAVKNNGNKKILKKDVLQELVKTLHLQKTVSETAGGLWLCWHEEVMNPPTCQSAHLPKTVTSGLLELASGRQSIAEVI